MFYETSTLENAYSKFSDIMYVKHWYKASTFKGTPIRISEEKRGKIIHINKAIKRPDWYRRSVRVEFRSTGSNRTMINTRLSLETVLKDAFILINNNIVRCVDNETLADIEKEARKAPKKGWSVEIIEPFLSLVYQRHGRNKWMLVEIGKGFA